MRTPKQKHIDQKKVLAATRSKHDCPDQSSEVSGKETATKYTSDTDVWL